MTDQRGLLLRHPICHERTQYFGDKHKRGRWRSVGIRAHKLRVPSADLLAVRPALRSSSLNPVEAPNPGAGRGGNGLFRGPACAASAEDFFSALEGSGPVSSRGIAAAVPADDPSPDRFGAAGVNGRVPGPHGFDCGFGPAEGLSTVDSAAPTSANGRLAEGLSTVDSAAPTYANGRLAPRRSQDRRGDGVSTKFVNALRRKRSGLTRDNSFRQGPRCGGFLRRLKRRRRTPTTPPSRPGCNRGGIRRGLALPDVRCGRDPLRIAGPRMARKPAGSRGAGLRNELPSRPRQGSSRRTASSTIPTGSPVV